MKPQILRGIWNLLMPRSCMRCGRRLTPAEHVLCAACLSQAPDDPLNPVKTDALEYRLRDALPLVRARALYRYGKDPEARRIIFAFKYRGKADLAMWAGRLMALRLAPTGFFHGVDALVPVPLHPRKQRLRGYNQAEQLARGVASVTGLPVLTDAVRRAVFTRTQTHLDPLHRRRNVSHVFLPGHTDGLGGKHLLLIDDVLTTGSTVTACASALKDVPRLRLSVLTFAYVSPLF